MHFTIISGSHRAASQSIKVARFVQTTLLQNKLCDTAEILNLANNPLPLWDQGVWDGEEKWKQLLDPICTQCQSSDAFVIVTPEYHGQVPAGLKNLFLRWAKMNLATNRRWLWRCRQRMAARTRLRNCAWAVTRIIEFVTYPSRLLCVMLRKCWMIIRRIIMRVRMRIFGIVFNGRWDFERICGGVKAGSGKRCYADQVYNNGMWNL